MNNMKRDMDLVRKILLKIEEELIPIQKYGYNKK